jgi:uracil-DNA glycosylase
MADAAPRRSASPLRLSLLMIQESIDAFVGRLEKSPAGPNSVNPFDHSERDNTIRRRNLELYLNQLAERRPATLLLGEAPSYRGMRVTGVPFTNTTILRRGIPHFGLLGTANGYEVPDAPRVAAEPTATVMWNALVELDFLPVLWSAYPLHPHRPGNPLSNRRPSAREATEWAWSWQELMDVFSIRSVVAVGNVAHDILVKSGLSVPRVRHPAQGGRDKFTLGLRELLAENIIA